MADYDPDLALDRFPASEAKRAETAWSRFLNWETWDWRIKYILIAPWWLFLCLRARSFWFFTTSNPTLTFGGFDGETKEEMYAQLPPGTYPLSAFVRSSTPVKNLADIVSANKLTYPVAVKPNIGKMGFMFRRINSLGDLEAYHHQIGCDYIIQEWIDYPIEVSVFYYRIPGESKGTITGFVRKDHLQVIGDGRSNLQNLIDHHPVAHIKRKELYSKHKEKLNLVLDKNERFCLSPALNLSRGGRLVSLEDEKDERLLNLFDNISHYTGSFFFGRYDIKCRSIAELKAARNFSILEYNGSGAEPHHIYGNGNSLWKACSILVQHWNALYRVSMKNREAGVKPPSFLEGYRFLRNANTHVTRLRQIDTFTPLY